MDCTSEKHEVEISPYPLSPSDAEMNDWKELETEFGQDWSMKLAAQLLSSIVEGTEEEARQRHNLSPSNFHFRPISPLAGSNDTRDARTTTITPT